VKADVALRAVVGVIMMVRRKPLAQSKPGVKQSLDLSVFENADLWMP